MYMYLKVPKCTYLFLKCSKIRKCIQIDTSPSRFISTDSTISKCIRILQIYRQEHMWSMYCLIFNIKSLMVASCLGGIGAVASQKRNHVSLDNTQDVFSWSRLKSFPSDDAKLSRQLDRVAAFFWERRHHLCVCACVCLCTCVLNTRQHTETKGNCSAPDQTQTIVYDFTHIYMQTNEHI